MKEERKKYRWLPWMFDRGLTNYSGLRLVDENKSLDKKLSKDRENYVKR